MRRASRSITLVLITSAALWQGCDRGGHWERDANGNRHWVPATQSSSGSGSTYHHYSGSGSHFWGGGSSSSSRGGSGISHSSGTSRGGFGSSGHAASAGS